MSGMWNFPLTLRTFFWHVSYKRFAMPDLVRPDLLWNNMPVIQLFPFSSFFIILTMFLWIPHPLLSYSITFVTWLWILGLSHGINTHCRYALIQSMYLAMRRMRSICVPHWYMCLIKSNKTIILSSLNHFHANLETWQEQSKIFIKGYTVIFLSAYALSKLIYNRSTARRTHCQRGQEDELLHNSSPRLSVGDGSHYCCSTSIYRTDKKIKNNCDKTALLLLIGQMIELLCN